MSCPICARGRRGPGIYLCSTQMKICFSIEVMLILLLIFIVHTKYSTFLYGLPYQLAESV